MNKCFAKEIVVDKTKSQIKPEEEVAVIMEIIMNASCLSEETKAELISTIMREVSFTDETKAELTSKVLTKRK